MSLFEQYGGFATVRRIVGEFYDAVLDDPSVSHHFAGTDMRRLIDHQTMFITYLMGGPGTNYSDEALAKVHRDLGVTHEEFTTVADILGDALEDHGVSDADRDTVVREFSRREPLIVEPLQRSAGPPRRAAGGASA